MSRKKLPSPSSFRRLSQFIGKLLIIHFLKSASLIFLITTEACCSAGIYFRLPIAKDRSMILC